MTLILVTISDAVFKICQGQLKTLTYNALSMFFTFSAPKCYSFFKGVLGSTQKQSKKKKKLLSNTLALGYLCQLQQSILG